MDGTPCPAVRDEEGAGKKCLRLTSMFDPKIWAMVPFHFWTVCFFVFGCVVGSFLNVCVHRLPREESIIHPPSHCPHCGYSIPWYFNIPLVTWLWLGARCANCARAISARYFLVELLTGVVFAACWLRFGNLVGCWWLRWSFA